MTRRQSARGFLLRMFSSVLIAVLAGSAVAEKPQTADRKDSKNRTNSQSLAGKIVSVKKKGRTTIVSIEDEQKDRTEHILNSRTPVKVSGPGDTGFLLPGAVVSTEAYKNQKNQLFGKSFTVYLNGSQNRGWKQGNTKEILNIVGQIIQKTDKELVLDMGRSGRGTVQLEEKYQVNIVSNDLDLIQEGSEVEMQGKSTRGRFRANSIEIKLVKPLDSKTYFESQKNGRKRSRGKSTRKERDSKGQKQGTSGENPFEEFDRKEKEKTKSNSKK